MRSKTKITLALLILSFALLLPSCVDKMPAATGETDENGVPTDFEFSITWGCYGDSTYNSKTGELVKQKAATKVGDYTTTYFLTDGQRAKIYDLVKEMNPSSYPDEYNPIKGMSTPSRDIVFTVTYGGKTKTITCKDVALSNNPKGSKGKKFMAVHDAIVNALTTSDEWLALPDYEFYYD